MLAIPLLEGKREQACIPIRQRILSYLDIGDLNRAIHASPLLLQAFRFTRKQLLLCTLFNPLGTTILEAFAVYRTMSIGFQASRTEEKVSLFLQALEKHRPRPTLMFELCGFFSEDDLVQMATFHNRVVRPLTQLLVSSVKYDLDGKGSACDAKTAHLELAFYRNQLDDNLFGTAHSYAFQISPGDHEPLRQPRAVTQALHFEDSDTDSLFYGILD